MSGPLILSIFPGIDGLGRGFESAWPECTVVRGPDVLWGGDIRTFHPPAGRFDGVIGGPPCQDFSVLQRYKKGRATFGNLIPEFERVVCEAEPRWFVMENVRGAPLPHIEGYKIESALFNNRHFGGEQSRERRISIGNRQSVPIIRWLYDWAPINGEKARTVIGGNGGGIAPSYSLAEMVRLQGFPDGFLEFSPMTREGKRKALGNAVPLPMAEAIARAVRRALDAPS